ncbi:hypothetical protein, partial [Streptomyces mangrovisoli]|uniref:hypothetical protein n=1 Tax=Streptomyces mangrovisoli TaxID=1428628 RepID=UPI0019D01EB3
DPISSVLSRFPLSRFPFRRFRLYQGFSVSLTTVSNTCTGTQKTTQGFGSDKLDAAQEARLIALLILKQEYDCTRGDRGHANPLG